jgi:polyhydroxybutyrate depolymerase
MIRATRLLVASAALVAVLACSASGAAARQEPGPARKPRESAGCRTRAPVPPGVTERTMTSGGVERRFQLTMPAGYDGTKPLPIVFALHALSISHTFVSGMTGFTDMTPRYDFIGVAPSGRLDGTTPFWLAAPAPDNYDVRFIGDLLDLLERELCIDKARVYSIGMSNGGQMSSLLACRLPGRFTAVAPIAGAEFPELCRGRPVPVIAFHGTTDPIVTYDGGGLNATRIADAQYWKGNVPPGLPLHRGVDAAMQTWAEHNGCDRRPVEERVAPEVRRRTWKQCKADTVLYVIDGGGHAWPGKPVPQFEASFGHATTQIDASTLSFNFFFSRRGPG